MWGPRTAPLAAHGAVDSMEVLNMRVLRRYTTKHGTWLCSVYGPVITAWVVILKHSLTCCSASLTAAAGDTKFCSVVLNDLQKHTLLVSDEKPCMVF
jgi:hypothetical protein